MRPHPGGTDTDPRLAQQQIEHIRSLTPSEKLNQVFELNELAFALHRAGLRKRYPDASERELQRLSVLERYDEAAVKLIFGDQTP
ncbi:MAG TPA: hypothetical protein VFB63_03225 [Bryobacteraceae bacterium]|jgi:hypothetical protein|nr:hypothetical protein [Bryobacteraceae bacterium]